MSNDQRKQLNDESNRGAAADALLKNALFNDAFMAINRTIWAQLTKVNVHSEDEIRALIMLQKANQKLYEYFKHHVQTGRMADIQLRELHSREER